MNKVDLDLSKMLGFKILDKDTQPTGTSQMKDVRLEAKVGLKPAVDSLGAKLGSKVGAKVGLKPI